MMCEQWYHLVPDFPKTTVPRLLTIGYEGTQIEAFLTTLLDAEVEQLLDVRAVPVSRKRGFSKTALSEALTRVGISYRHLKHLGDPKPGRDAARAGHYETFRRIYADHLNQDAAQGALREAVVLGHSLTSCLLCFERDPRNCHRSIVAAEMRAIGGFEVAHLR